MSWQRQPVEGTSLSAKGFAGVRVRPARLATEARIAVASLSPAEWAQLAAFASGAAAVGTVNSKIIGIRNLGRRIFATSRLARDRAGEVGLKESIKTAPRQAVGVTNAVLNKAREGFRAFLALEPMAKRDALADVLVAGVTTYVVAGGGDLEGGLPDTDLILGVGHHRNPFSHTILIAISVEGSIRFTAAALSRLHGHLPEDHDPIWDSILDAFNRTYEAAVVGVWLGTALHLMKDVGIPGVRTKPYVMLPMSLTNAGHQALLATNAIVATALGVLTASSMHEYTKCPDD